MTRLLVRNNLEEVETRKMWFRFDSIDVTELKHYTNTEDDKTIEKPNIESNSTSKNIASLKIDSRGLILDQELPLKFTWFLRFEVKALQTSHHFTFRGEILS